MFVIYLRNLKQFFFNVCFNNETSPKILLPFRQLSHLNFDQKNVWKNQNFRPVFLTVPENPTLYQLSSASIFLRAIAPPTLPTTHLTHLFRRLGPYR